MHFASRLILVALVCVAGTSQSQNPVAGKEVRPAVPTARKENQQAVKEVALIAYKHLGLMSPPAMDTLEFGAWVAGYQRVLRQNTKEMTAVVEKLWSVRKDTCQWVREKSEEKTKVSQLAAKAVEDHSVITAVGTNLLLDFAEALSVSRVQVNYVQLNENLTELQRIQEAWMEDSERALNGLRAAGEYFDKSDCDKML